MIIPFRFDLVAATPYGVLWNPWSAVVPTSDANQILAGLNAAQKTEYDLNPPTGHVIVTGLVITGDAAAAKVSLGVYDIDAAAFRELYPIASTIIAGQPLVDEVLPQGGYTLPLSATRVPCLRLLTAGAVELCGHVAVFPQSRP